MSRRELDGAVIVRAASRGFTVLLLGGAVQPWVIRLQPLLGYWWLAIVAVAAFVVAAHQAVCSAQVARTHWAQGALAALSGYLLVVPIVLHVAGRTPWGQLLWTGATALVVGALTQRLLSLRTPQRGSTLPPGAEAGSRPCAKASVTSK